MSDTAGVPIGDRMKTFELATRHVLPPRTHTIVRVDGKAFHSYLRGATKPYDHTFMDDMDAVAIDLCQEISGAAFAFVQSDEVSVLVTDFGSPGTQPWLGGVVSKWTSITASIATATLNARRPDKRALFDARAFTIADPVEVASYFVWRQRDCVRNSISMAAQSMFSARQLHGVNTADMQEMMRAQHGVNWDDYPAGCKRGRVVSRQGGEREFEYTDRRSGQIKTAVAFRTWWEASPAAQFNTNPDGFLSQAIPPMGARVRGKSVAR